jgi:hypothetical protein
MQIITNAIAADAIATYQAEIEQLRQHAPSKRRDALVAMREQLIEELMGCMELGDEMAEVACEMATEAVEVSAALEQAITTAQATGCAVVLGAHSLVRELTRLVPGCIEQRNGLEIATVSTDDGELRLVRRAGSYRAAASWRAA